MPRIRQTCISLVEDPFELRGVHLVEHPHHGGGQLRNRRWHNDRFRCNVLTVSQHRPLIGAWQKSDIRLPEGRQVVQPHITVDRDALIGVHVEADVRIAQRCRDAGDLTDRYATQEDTRTDHKTFDIGNCHREIDAALRRAGVQTKGSDVYRSDRNDRRECPER
ncbi:Uncharacterised protein [Mycobacteroides abscessus subsp. abscessus]|nr:Uncharacterised protein [Mycobacteroides abscessus subsp. abscessus]